MLYSKSLSFKILLSLGLILMTSASPTAAPSTVRSTQNKISLLAGTGTYSSSGTGGPATSASVKAPLGVWSDSVGYIFFVEQAASCVRKFALTNSIVVDVAGVCGGSSTFDEDNVPATAATINPWYVHGDSVGTLYVNDCGNSRVRKIVSNVISTFAGIGTQGSSGNGGPATSAQLYNPSSLFLDSSNRLYFASYDGYEIRSVSSGIINAAVGTKVNGFSGMGGPATSAKISTLEGLFIDTASNLHFSDSGNSMIFTVSNAVISKVLGTGTSAYSGENVPMTSTSVVYPIGITVDSSNGDMYIGTHTGKRVLVTTKTTGLVSTFAGNGDIVPVVDGIDATSAGLYFPCGLMLSGGGSLYVAEYSGNRLRLVYSGMPTTAPSAVPSIFPSLPPSVVPTLLPTVLPSLAPSTPPSVLPSLGPTITPTLLPTVVPTVSPSLIPSVTPTMKFVPISNSPSFKITNVYAFAGLTSDGAVLTWGKSDVGGDSSSVSGSLSSGVTDIVASKCAYAALKSDGSVIAWGRAAEISGWSVYSSASAGVVSLVGSEQAFAGVTSAGGVIAFGADCCGGNVDQYGYAQYLTSDVKSVTASSGAFCALKTDGSVYCWGSAFAGGGVSSSSRSDIADVVLLVASRSAFAALKSTGVVLVWGSKECGGVLSSALSSQLTSVQLILSSETGFVAYTTSNTVVSWGLAGSVSGLSDVTFVAHTPRAFAAIKLDGSVVAWGDSNYGGTTVANRQNVTSIVGSEGGSFAALNGTVIAWGNTQAGGLLFANVSSEMSNVESLYHTRRAFAALSSSGAVTVWGASHYGGVIPTDIATNLKSGVKLICANDVSFTAIKSDGSAYGWGRSGLGQNLGLLTGDYSRIDSCGGL